MAKVSVVVCAKNEEQYLERCLKLLKAQSVMPEIVVVDGHSTDTTIKIAENYADNIVKDNKKGLGEARNIGWKQSSGEIIAFCDADSTPPKDWVKNIIELFTNATVLGVSGPVTSHDGDTHLRLAMDFWANKFPVALARVGFHNCWGANMAFRKEALEKYPFRCKFLEDYDMGEQLRQINGIKFDETMKLPISSRRFGDLAGFYKVCAKDYIFHILKVKLTGERSAGYYEE